MGKVLQFPETAEQNIKEAIIKKIQEGTYKGLLVAFKGEEAIEAAYVNLDIAERMELVAHVQTDIIQTAIIINLSELI